MSVGLLPFSAQVDNTNAVWLGAVARGGEIDRSIETARADKSKYVTQSSQTPGRTDSPGAQMTPTHILGSGWVFERRKGNLGTCLPCANLGSFFDTFHKTYE